MRKNWPMIGGVAMVIAMIGTPTPAPATPPSSSAPQLVTITIPAPPGEIGPRWLTYPGAPRADVLLPRGYDPSVRYPLLVLLAGLGNDYASYAEDGIVAKLSDLDAIVVMPEGANGWYADWWNGGERGRPGWESYELDSVLPTILARYPIRPERRYHTIAGVSMGGLGAVYLGGRLPGFFGTVASLSGFDDPGFFSPLTDPAMGYASFAPFEGDDHFDAVYGPADGFYFRGHNPALLATNLQQTRVFESTGTGVPSGDGMATLEQGGSAAAAILSGSALESTIIFPMNQLYHRALTAAGVDVTYQIHQGGHDIPDFDNEFDALLAWGLFNPVVTDPASWTNDTVAGSGQLWDIGYRFAQPPTQVVQFRQSGSVLSISAAGTPVTIITSTGCTINALTPATISLPTQGCTSSQARVVLERAN